MRRAGVVYYAKCERKGRWEPPAPPDVLSGWVQVWTEEGDEGGARSSCPSIRETVRSGGVESL